MVAVLFLVSLGGFIAAAIIKTSPFLPSHYSLFANGLEKALTPLALITFLTLGYLVYFYRQRAKQSELALRQVNTALESSHELVDKLTNCDPLTDTLNRKGLEKFIGPDVRLAEQMGMPIIALIADCDGFRRINDRFGREGGDIVLKEIAARLKRSARRTDRLGRVDGDQFLLLLHEATPNDANQVAERIAVAVANQPITIGSSQVAVSLSLGMSILTSKDSSLAQVLNLLRPSLQKSKSLRPNQVL
jgi:diguanylate cyclase (GGDEF)-like protein